MDDLLKEFLTETGENLANLDSELVRLERQPDDPNLLGSIFRVVHTIKGTCGFIGLPRLERVAHAAENVLGKVRDGALAASPAIISLILDALDRLKSILAGIEVSGAEIPGDDEELVALLDRAAAGDLLVAEQPAAGHAAAPASADSAPAPSTDAPRAADDHGAAATQSIRVNLAVLDNLMTLVGELVLTRNQLLRSGRGAISPEAAQPLQRLSQVTSELQDAVMRTRMQPIGNAWNKLPRLVRDLARDLGKKIALDMRGAETELDRQVLEMIKDPLTHMVRNSADHGLETPAERLAAGKPENGTIRLDAYHRGGHIVIEIGDDGRGLSSEKIRRKAVANGLATEVELAALSEQQIHQFIFRAGFSTAAAVTAVSGRGVGMDVVRTNIEGIGGTIELRSRENEGTTFVIRIPLTLAIVSALLVECAGGRFAVPQIGVRELVQTGPGARHRIETINGSFVLRLRDRLLPLVSLRQLLHPGLTEAADAARFIVVAEIGADTLGIIVDGVFDTEEIVVKPVADVLRDVPVFAGSTILGDGSVVMILDVNAIAGMAVGIGKEVSGSRASAASETDEERARLLVFRSGGVRRAMPLSAVARLEEVESTAIERTEADYLLQYRGRLMTLTAIDAGWEPRASGKQPILVLNGGIGLPVDEIVDIVEDRLRIEVASQQPGRAGTAVIDGKATEILDPAWFERALGEALDARALIAKAQRAAEEQLRKVA